MALLCQKHVSSYFFDSFLSNTRLDSATDVSDAESLNKSHTVSFRPRDEGLCKRKHRSVSHISFCCIIALLGNSHDGKGKMLEQPSGSSSDSSGNCWTTVLGRDPTSVRFSKVLKDTRIQSFYRQEINLKRCVTIPSTKSDSSAEFHHHFCVMLQTPEPSVPCVSLIMSLGVSMMLRRQLSITAIELGTCFDQTRSSALI